MARRQIISGILGASFLAAGLPGLSLAQDDEPFAAEGLGWLLASYTDGEAMVDVMDDVDVTLLLDAGEAVGSAGCNSYFGSYEIDEQSLTFGPLGSTLAFCEGPGQETEDAYLPLLAEVVGWEVEEKTLSLLDEEEAVILVYDEAPIDIMGSDLIALASELDGLQAQLDGLDETVEGLKVRNLRNRVAGLEATVDSIEEQLESQTVSGLRNRVKNNEVVLDDVVSQLADVRTRVNELENGLEELDDRVAAIEEIVPTPEQPLP